jgi:hypothetical protein
MESNFWGDRHGTAIVWDDRDKRPSRDKSRARKKFPADITQDLPKVRLAGLVEGQLQVRGDSGSVNVVVHVSARVSARDLILVVIQEELTADYEASATIICDEAGYAYCGRRRFFVVLAKGENITEHRNDSRTDRGARYWKRGDYDRPAFWFFFFLGLVVLFGYLRRGWLVGIGRRDRRFLLRCVRWGECHGLLLAARCLGPSSFAVSDSKHYASNAEEEALMIAKRFAQNEIPDLSC